MPDLNKKLVRESRWMRVYKLGDRLLYESKFLADGLQVSSASLKTEWKFMDEEERAEFAMAFLAKPNLQQADEEILDHLMEVGSRRVLRSIALLAVRQSDKERALRFLTQQIEGGQKPLSNFYQALELLKDRRAVPTLRRVYERYHTRVATGRCDESDLVEYVECGKALFAIEGNPYDREAISQLRDDPNEEVRRVSEQLLKN